MPRPHRLLLMRHAEPEHRVLGLTGGFTDRPLTPHGRREAACLAEAVAALDLQAPVRLFASDLVRTRETAEAVAAPRGLEVELRPALRELDNGVAAHRTLDEARALERPRTEPVLDWVPYEGGESWRTMGRRVTRFLENEADRSTAATWLVVSHGNAMVAVVHAWLGLGEEHWDRIHYDFERASLTVLSTNEEGERVIERLNDCAHLRSLGSPPPRRPAPSCPSRSAQ